jgi:hypothetical protein
VGRLWRLPRLGSGQGMGRVQVKAPVRRFAQVRAFGRSVALSGLLASGLLAAGLSSPIAVEASSGYHETATTTYTLNPANNRLDVELEITFKNTSRSTATTQYYYLYIYAWLEHAATHVAATTDHGEAIPRFGKREGAYDRWDVQMAKAILYGNTRHIFVTYQLPSGAPRSSSSVRVNRAFASFCVAGMGDDGGTVRVVAPKGYDFDVQGEGGDLTQTTSGDTQVWSSGFLDDPFGFWSCLSGASASGYDVSKLTSPGGRQVFLESWPDDTTWRSETMGEVSGDLSKLETLVGRPLAGSGPIIVREVAGAELGAYAGFFDPTTGIAIVGEDFANDGTVAHELSHEWFNDGLFVERWMSEGMAEWARINVVPGTCPAPGTYPGVGVPNLASWQFAGPKASKTELAEVDYEYRAACYIVATLSAKAGPGGMRTALSAMFDRKLAYRSGTTVLDSRAGALTWREWLDDIDELAIVPAGGTDLDFAQKLVAGYGIPEAGTDLAKRSAARAKYHALMGAVGSWSLPEAVLRNMAEWRFDDATAAMDDVSKAYSILQAADVALPGIDATGGPVEAMVEAAKTDDDLKAAEVKAQGQLDAAKAVASAEAALAEQRDLFEQIGLSGTDPGTALPDAIAAAKRGDNEGTLAHVASITAALDGAAGIGQERVGVAVGVSVVLLVLLLLVIRRSRRRRTWQPAPAQEVAVAQLDVDPSPPIAEPAAPDVTDASPPGT